MPSTGPLLHACRTAFSTAAQSFLRCRTNRPIASSPVASAFSTQRLKLDTLPRHRMPRKLSTQWRVVAKPGQRRFRIATIPQSEHWIDWFHITMRIAVLQQQTKSLQSEANRATEAAEWSAQIDSVKHLLWQPRHWIE